MSMDVLKVEDVAAILQVSDRQVRNYLKEGTLQGFKLKREWRIERSALEKFIQTQTQNQLKGDK